MAAPLRVDGRPGGRGQFDHQEEPAPGGAGPEPGPGIRDETEDQGEPGRDESSASEGNVASSPRVIIMATVYHDRRRELILCTDCTLWLPVVIRPPKMDPFEPANDRLVDGIQSSVKTSVRAPSVDRRYENLGTARCVATTAWPVTCEEFRAEAGHAIPRHTHDQPHVCLVLRGTLIERDRTGRHRMPAGHARISAAGDEHDLEIGDERPLRCLILSIAPECFDDPQAALPAQRRYITGPGVREFGRRLRGELHDPDDTSPLSLEMLALEVAALGQCSPGARIEATPSWLERVRKRVRDDIRSIPTLAELARDAGVSRAHLARTFRARYGYTVGQFVRHQRLETARRLILTTEKPLAVVAYEAGFADQSHMTRQIGARFGHPPGRLRRLSGSA